MVCYIVSCQPFAPCSKGLGVCRPCGKKRMVLNDRQVGRFAASSLRRGRIAASARRIFMRPGMRCCGDKNGVVRGLTVIKRRVSRACANLSPTQATTQQLLDGRNGKNAHAYSALQGRSVNDRLHWLEDDHRQSCRIFNVDRPINMTEWIGYCFKSECLRLSRVFDSCARRGHSRSRGTVYRTVELRGHDMFAIIVVCTF